MRINKMRVKQMLFLHLLPFLSVAIITLSGSLISLPFIELVKISVLTLILTSIFDFYVSWNVESILKYPFAKTILILSYLISLLLLMLIPDAKVNSLWMLGGLMVSMMIDYRLGLLIHFNMALILGITFFVAVQTMILLLVISVLLCLLSGALKQLSMAVYAVIIILSTNMTLSFVINNFMIDSKEVYPYFNSLFSLFIILVVSILSYLLYQKFAVDPVPDLLQFVEAAQVKDPVQVIPMEDTENYNVREDITDDDGQEESEDILPYGAQLRTSFDLLIQEENDLLLKLKEVSEQLYQHALYIGDISLRAAAAIGANEMIAKAGGLYHEIGKLNSNSNYIEEGLKIAQEYGFPRELIVILKQHNIKFEKPTSVEAAIVMLSDHVISTIDYIEKSGDKKYTTSKIIDNIFQMRMDKGTFDEAGLSVRDFKNLKIFYLNEFNRNSISIP